MLELDLGMVNWARAQFTLTAMYHWLFVPITLGLSFLCAFYETIYVRTGKEEWKRLTKFWMTLFGINFAIGVATGIILEFEFGTNWSNYSWMVGDIFGAPLAIEGIFAFFIEATFFAVMFFGWERTSKGFHLFSTWMVAVGSNLSALWILVANGWMQYPAGMTFNPDTARFEMQNIWEVVLSPVAVAKFTRTMGTMLSSGVAILDGLDIVAKTAGHKTVELAIYDVRSSIKEGRTMSDPLSESGVFPPMVCSMIAVGESTGALDTMMLKIADFYDEEVDEAVGRLTEMIEPMMMVFLGIVVGGLVISMYLPIFTMAGHIG